MPRQQLVCAMEQHGDMEHLAEYEVDSGNLRILIDGVTVHDLYPPDSWIAIASVATGSDWERVPRRTIYGGFCQIRTSRRHRHLRGFEHEALS